MHRHWQKRNDGVPSTPAKKEDAFPCSSCTWHKIKIVRKIHAPWASNRPLTQTPRLRHRVSVPSQAGALRDCGINQKTFAIVFTSGKDSGLYLFALWVKSRWRSLIFCLYNIMNDCNCALRLAGWGGGHALEKPSRAVKSDSTRHVIFVHMYVSKVSVFL